MEEDLRSKQLFLRTEIIDQGYDPSDFHLYMCSIRQEESINLDDWSSQEIRSVVKSFKESRNNEVREKQNNMGPNEVIDENLKIKEQQEKQENNENVKKEVKLQSRNTIVSIENQLKKQEGDAFDYFEKIIFCEKLENNQITNREDLYITISEPVKINPGFFSISYYQYSVKTFPLNYSVSRKVSDFSFLSQKLPLIHPVRYTPSLPSFQYGLKDDSPKKMLYIQYFMNLLIENKYFRTLPIVFDFLTLPQEDWNKKVKNKYSKIKEAPGFDTMPNFDDKYILKITKEDELKATNIKNEINPKSETLLNINSYFDDLLLAIDKVSACFKNIGLSFDVLQKYYKNNKILNQGYKSLSNLFKIWSNDYLTQKQFFKNDIKYYFKFINKEYINFLKNYENYRLARDEYKKTFDRMKKNKNPTDNDLFLLKDIQKYYAFELIHVNEEYKNLEERQGKRLIKQFVKFSKNKNIIFQDFEKCCNLCKFQEYANLKDNNNKIVEDEIIINNNDIVENNADNNNNINNGNNEEVINNNNNDNTGQTDNNINNINIIQENNNDLNDRKEENEFINVNKSEENKEIIIDVKKENEENKNENNININNVDNNNNNTEKEKNIEKAEENKIEVEKVGEEIKIEEEKKSEEKKDEENKIVEGEKKEENIVEIVEEKKIEVEKDKLDNKKD